jgi:hypothetical protein
LQLAQSRSDAHNQLTFQCVEQVTSSSKGLFKIFQKAPAPTGAFWFLHFVNLHRCFLADKTSPDSTTLLSLLNFFIADFNGLQAGHGAPDEEFRACRFHNCYFASVPDCLQVLISLAGG